MVSKEDMRNFCDQFIAAKVIRKKSLNGWCHVVNDVWNDLTSSNDNNFLKRASTLGKYIYMPSDWDYNETPIETTYVTFKHEAEHLVFFRRFGLVFGLIIYLFLPFPVLFAYGRYRVERNAVLEELLAIDDLGLDYARCMEDYIQALSGRAYFYAWPFKSLTRRWLNKNFRLRKEKARMKL
jgi:hypothetical protein